MLEEISKIKIFHFCNDSEGGVFSVVRNLLASSKNNLIENHIIFTINRDKKKNFSVPQMEGCASCHVFQYSSKWNFFYTCKRLSKYLPDEKALIVAHDWLELGMASVLGLQNPVIQFVHGDYEYYYDLAYKHERITDKFITVADSIKRKLVDLLPEREKEIIYQRFPVTTLPPTQIDRDMKSIIFLGRLTKCKGYHLLPAIADALNERGVLLNWHIVGSGYTNNPVEWGKIKNVHFYGQLQHRDVINLLSKVSFLVLPSQAEGMPLCVIEAMKCGVIPIVNNIEGGIQELVFDNKTGFKIFNNDVEGYAEKLALLLSEAELCSTIRKKGQDLANDMFDPYYNTLQIEETFLAVLRSQSTRKKSRAKIYGSRLDKRWIPNAMVSIYRNLRKAKI